MSRMPRRVATIALAATLVAALATCSRSPASRAVETGTPAPDAAPTTTRVAAEPEPETAPGPAVEAEAEPPAPPDPDSCEGRSAAYLAEREKLNRCERDDDCAEIWPGACPHGPYYVHRESDPTAVHEAAARMSEACPRTECAKPLDLGPATCTNGRCVAGREPPPDPELCWDYLERYIENGDAVETLSVQHIQGITERFAYGAEAPGTLRVEVEWPMPCPDCTLAVSERNSQMGSPIEGRRTVDGSVLTVEIDATPGLYFFLPLAPPPAVYVMLRVWFDRTDGEPATATHHGRAWPRVCED